MRNREENGRIVGVSEVVVAPLDVVKSVPSVLEGTDDFTRLKGRDARAHDTLRATATRSLIERAWWISGSRGIGLPCFFRTLR